LLLLLLLLLLRSCCCSVPSTLSRIDAFTGQVQEMWLVEVVDVIEELMESGCSDQCMFLPVLSDWMCRCVYR